MRFTIEMIPSVAAEPRRRSATVMVTVVAAFALLLSLLVSVTTVSAVAPNVATGSGITVDGDAGEWEAGDFFADMYRAGDATKEVESTLSLRYDCDAGILYVLVETAPGVDLVASDGDNFVKFGMDDKRVDGSDAPADGVQPDFEYLAGDSGWEASFSIAPGTYDDLNVHAQVEDGGEQTSAVEGRAISMTIACPAPTETPTPTGTPGTTATPTPTPEGSEAGSTNTPTPTATATPEGSQQGSTGTPAPSRTPEGDVAAATGTPAGGNLPNTASGTPLTTPLVAFGFGLLLLGSIGTLAYANVAANRRRR